MDFSEIERARERLTGIIKPTRLLRSDTFDRLLGAEVFLKPENRQKTGSFKIRGAFNRLASFSPDEARRGVIAASAGNHGQALSYAATRAGIVATIVMPRTAAILGSWDTRCAICSRSARAREVRRSSGDRT